MAGPNGQLSKYLARRWRAVPVHAPDPESGGCSCGKADCAKPGKHPVGQHWPAGSDDPGHFAGRNIGVKLGPDSGDLGDVDLDSAEAIAVADLLLPATESAFGRGGQVTHALYRVPDRGAC
jgi:hypothetical protein